MLARKWEWRKKWRSSARGDAQIEIQILQLCYFNLKLLSASGDRSAQHLISRCNVQQKSESIYVVEG